MIRSSSPVSAAGAPVASFPFDPSVAHWVALRTAARWEKKIAGTLTDAGAAVFLPLMTRLTAYRGKRRAVEVPVFSGYLFCEERGFLGNPRVPAACRAKVAQVLRPPDPALLRAELLSVV